MDSVQKKENPQHRKNDMLRLNLNSHLWEEVCYKGDTRPKIRSGFTGGGSLLHFANLLFLSNSLLKKKVWKNRFFVVHGGVDVHNEQMNCIEVFDLYTNMWIPIETKGEKPVARASHSGVIWRNYFYIYGQNLFLYFSSVLF